MGAATIIDGVALEAARLVVNSDVMGVVAVVGASAAWAFAGWLQARAAAPHGTPGAQFSAAPQVVFGAIRSLPSTAPVRSATAPSSLVAMAVTVTSLLVLPLAVVAGVYLLVAGHVPTGRTAFLAVSVLVCALAGGFATAARVRSCEGRRDWIARRGPHVFAAALAGEAVVLASALLVAGVVTHTENSAVSFVDIACSAAIARAMTLLRHPPAGAVLADVTLVALLTTIGVSLTASVAIAGVWRGSTVVAWILLRVLSGRRPLGPPLDLGSSPTGSRAGERVHRSAFRMIGLLPERLRDRTRRRLFETLFAMSEDPWAYDVLPYERRKREHLLRHLPTRAAVIVEVGCADGHVLAAIGRARQTAIVIGVDISEAAVLAARGRTENLDNTVVMRGAMAEAAEVIRRHTSRPVDVLILSEVLYYLGTPAQIARDLSRLQPLLAAEARVLLAHPENDARELHGPALEALGCELAERAPMADADRPVVLDVGRRSAEAIRTFGG